MKFPKNFWIFTLFLTRFMGFSKDFLFITSCSDRDQIEQTDFSIKFMLVLYLASGIWKCMPSLLFLIICYVLTFFPPLLLYPPLPSWVDWSCVRPLVRQPSPHPSTLLPSRPPSQPAHSLRLIGGNDGTHPCCPWQQSTKAILEGRKLAETSAVIHSFNFRDNGRHWLKNPLNNR